MLEPLQLKINSRPGTKGAQHFRAVIYAPQVLMVTSKFVPRILGKRYFYKRRSYGL